MVWVGERLQSVHYRHIHPFQDGKKDHQDYHYPGTFTVPPMSDGVTWKTSWPVGSMTKHVVSTRWTKAFHLDHMNVFLGVADIQFSALYPVSRPLTFNKESQTAEQSESKMNTSAKKSSVFDQSFTLRERVGALVKRALSLPPCLLHLRPQLCPRLPVLHRLGDVLPDVLWPSSGGGSTTTALLRWLLSPHSVHVYRVLELVDVCSLKAGPPTFEKMRAVLWGQSTKGSTPVLQTPPKHNHRLVMRISSSYYNYELIAHIAIVIISTMINSSNDKKIWVNIKHWFISGFLLQHFKIRRTQLCWWYSNIC